MSTQLNREQAIAFHDSKAYELMSHSERALFQINQKLLCMPFGVFHEAIESALGRPVFTHEFVDSDRLRKELMGEKPAPTFDEILALIPEDKRIVILKASTPGSDEGASDA